MSQPPLTLRHAPTAPLALPAEGVLVELKQMPFSAHDVFTYEG